MMRKRVILILSSTKKTSGAYDYMVACSDLSDMFSYIFLRVKEKKHAVLKMIDTNIISKTINRISAFSQYTDPVYKQYSDQYKNYMDLDIIAL